MLPANLQPRGVVDHQILIRKVVFYGDAWWADLAARGLKVASQLRQSGDVCLQSEIATRQGLLPGELLWKLSQRGGWIWNVTNFTVENREELNFFAKCLEFADRNSTRVHSCPCNLLNPLKLPLKETISVKFLCDFFFAPSKVQGANSNVANHHEDGSFETEMFSSTSVAMPGYPNFSLGLQLTNMGGDEGLILEPTVFLTDARKRPPAAQSRIAVDLFVLNSGEHCHTRHHMYDDGDPLDVIVDKICGGEIPAQSKLLDPSRLGEAVSNGLRLRCAVVVWSWELQNFRCRRGWRNAALERTEDVGTSVLCSCP